jgi:hypothetical protein
MHKLYLMSLVWLIIPEITILLLGDAEVWKLTFQSYTTLSFSNLNPCHSSLIQCGRPIYNLISQNSSRISKGPSGQSSSTPILLLRDGDQPFIFDIQFSTQLTASRTLQYRQPRELDFIKSKCRNLMLRHLISSQPHQHPTPRTHPFPSPRTPSLISNHN